MTTATGVPADVEAYLAAERGALEDVPTEERDDLLAEVQASLVEAAGESEVPLSVRLGPAGEFAAELRASAGLRPAPADRPAGRSALAAARALARRVHAHALVAPALRALRELAPIWWLLRALILVAATSEAVGTGWSTRHPFVPRLGGGAVGAALVLGTTLAVSVALGLRSGASDRRLRQLAIAANVVLALAALPVARHLLRATPAGPRELVYVNQPNGPDLTSITGIGSARGGPVRNVYPYSRGGRLLQDVLLYDQDGMPLDLGLGAPDPDRRFLVTDRGDRLYNSFPVRYFEHGTTVVAHPETAPRIKRPRVLTAPLSPTAPGRRRNR